MKSFCDSLNLKIIFFRFEIDPETSLVVVENKLKLVASNNTIAAIKNLYYKFGIFNGVLFSLGYYDVEQYKIVKEWTKVSVFYN